MIGPYSRSSYSRQPWGRETLPFYELLFDTVRRVGNTLSTDYDTIRRVAHTFTIDFDTIRRVGHLFTDTYDTIRSVARTYSHDFDTIRRVIGGYVVMYFDTVRRVFKNYADERYPTCYPPVKGKGESTKKCGVCARCRGLK